MKGRKDEEKMMGPLFPRLHVNDTEKGGPRAPPRNKMALYEQLSVPSQRFNSSSSTLPLPPHHTSTLVPSASSSQGGDHERSVFSPIFPSSTPAHSTEKLHSRSSDGMNFTGRMEFGRKSLKNGNYKTSNATVTTHLLSPSDCNLTRPHDFSNSKISSGKKSAEDDDFTVPTYQQDGEVGRLNPIPVYPGQSAVTMVNGPQNSIAANYKFSNQLQNTVDRPLKWAKTTDLKSKIQGRNPREQSPINTAVVKQNTEMATSHSSVAEKIAEVSKQSILSSIGKHTSASINEHENLHTENSQFCEETSAALLSENDFGADGNSVEPRCSVINGIAEKQAASTTKSESGSRASLGNSRRNPTPNAANCIKENECNAQLGNTDGNDDQSDTSMVDSISGLDISPDDVVGAIGQKHFWKTRKAIVNQQRVFAVQVFELHRLIKVQKLIAGSPDLLLENNPYLSRPPKVPNKKSASNHSLKSQQQMIMQTDGSSKPSQNMECPSSKGDSQKPSIPLVDGVDKGLVDQNSNNGPYSGSIPTAPSSADNNASPWCFHMPGNQWLVPIMSPSEGLVYKPYMGPCPPNIGLMTPVYGGCGPLSLPPIPAYGIPASHQQPGVGVISGAPMVAQSRFPPAYGMPVMNPMISNPADEQGTPAAVAQPQQQAKQVSTRDANLNMHSRSSCDFSNHKSEAFSCCVRKVRRTSKDSEVQGSTASSPSERAQEAGHVAEGREERDALPLFPLGAPMDDSDQTPQIRNGDQQARVIKVVPHNPRSAPESAARIFRSIQKERQHTTHNYSN